MTLPQLQSQIESEAVKALDNFCKERDGVVLWSTTSILKGDFKKFLTSTLHQATQRVAEKTVEALDYGNTNGGTINQRINSWLNHNSEEGK